MWGWGWGEAILKDMKVLIGQRGNREVYAEGERLWNGQAFLHFDCLCVSANLKTGGKEWEKEQNAGMLSSFPEAPLENFLSTLEEQGAAMMLRSKQCANFHEGWIPFF